MDDISPDFLTDSATVRHKLPPGKGKAGGERMQFSDWSPPFACAIFPASSDTLIQAGQPDLVNGWEVHFGSDPGLDDGDLIQPGTGGRPLFVKGRLRWASNHLVVIAEGQM